MRPWSDILRALKLFVSVNEIAGFGPAIFPQVDFPMFNFHVKQQPG
jgi:hypothetical protein